MFKSKWNNNKKYYKELFEYVRTREKISSDVDTNRNGFGYVDSNNDNGQKRETWIEFADRMVEQYKRKESTNNYDQSNRDNEQGAMSSF